jgi:hypothetical protein
MAGFYIAHQWPSRNRGDEANLLAVCNICNLGMAILSRSLTGSHSDLQRNTVLYPGPGHRILSIWPDKSKNGPEGVPSNIENFYLQGLANLKARRWDAAGAMFRKTLDVGTKIIAPTYKGDPLFSRINKLVGDGTLTQAMGDWSHEIRMDGNDAVHDENPETEEDANASQHFTEAFLTYAFALPKLVEDNKAKSDPASKAETA